jgi:hypothetical protein
MPLFYFLVDLACVNAFLLQIWSSTANLEHNQRTHNGHQAFISALYTQLLESNIKASQMKESLPISKEELDQGHKHIQTKSYNRCEWGKHHPPGYPRKRAPKRKFGTDITEAATNGANEAVPRGSKTYFKCSKCQVWLCIEGSCWQRYHHSIEVNI